MGKLQRSMQKEYAFQGQSQIRFYYKALQGLCVCFGVQVHTKVSCLIAKYKFPKPLILQREKLGVFPSISVHVKYLWIRHFMAIAKFAVKHFGIYFTIQPWQIATGLIALLKFLYNGKITPFICRFILAPSLSLH